MSNPLRAVGKAFRKVVKVAKKIALPALAIGAVVLTGGAALGALPKVGVLLGKIGISGTLASVLSTAATAATIGAGGALLTGGNIISGATQGLLIGGITGGIGALAAPASAAGATGAAAAKGATAASNAAGAASTGSVGLGTAGSQAAQGILRAAPGGVNLAAPAVSSAGVAASAAAPVSMLPAATAAVPTSSGGFLDGLGRAFSSMNPIVQGQLIAGIGQGISANEDAKDVRREREAIQANYANTSGFFRLDPAQQRQGLGNLQPAAQRYSQSIYGRSRLTYDPATGRVMPVGG